MNDTSPWPASAPTPLQRMDHLCDRFEDAWLGGTPPRIEDYLPCVEAAERAALLRELLRLDLAYRGRAGDAPDPEEYRRRFPAFGEEVAAAFLRQSSGPVNVGAPSGCVAPALVPRPLPEVPGYEIESVLGRGGMGVVYKARHLRLNRVVALTMILGGHVGPEQHARLLTEARATAKLRHPHIVQIHEIGEADPPFLALEFVEGGSLQKLLTGAPLPPRRAAELVRTLAGAVGHAHAQGVTHRDLKPANVLLTAAGDPKVADFGLAKVADAGGTLTASGAVLGTPAYMAPEQARGDASRTGPAADVHALGVILFELLTGRRPYAADNPTALLRKIEHDEPPSPRAVAAAVPRDLEAICLRCLEKEPADRYATAEDLAEDLACYLDGRPLRHARHTRPLGRLWRRCRRNPLAAVLSAAVAALGCVVAGVLLATAPPPEGDTSLARVQRSGKFVVGVDPIGAPYSLWDWDSKPAGIDIDVARAVAAGLGVSAEHIQLHWHWPTLVAQLDERKVDAVISCVSITDERKKQVAFVEYATDPFVFVAHRGSPVRTRADLAGRPLVVQNGTAAHGIAERLRQGGVPLTVVARPTVPDTFTALRAAKGGVLLEHDRIARHGLGAVGPDFRVFPSDGVDPALAGQRIGIMLRHDAAALQAAVEQTVEAMRQNGSLDAIFEAWDPPRP